MEEKFKNMKGQLEIMKALGIKPNYSELERAFGIERHTVKKYYEGYEGKSPNRNRPSKLDKYYDEIKSKLIDIYGENSDGALKTFIKNVFNVNKNEKSDTAKEEKNNEN